ncbi:aminotransferase class I/II-fold pyridoxal phosphate-dependent enzyme [Paracoccus sp. p3-h83]|uniref:aminotransferase class I/II-fold pyridoxal phosphate-dependent enzyme n=1 Tax=Paracoccus sp. p3-h83 TaxID=3342805 RepID=UPI0035B8C859
MTFPERFLNLPEYAFPRLRALLDPHPPGAEPINMTIGEPRHAFPDFVGAAIADSLADFGRYPTNEGTPELLGAISDWISRRYGVSVAADRLMVLNGTREGLFNAALALVPETKRGARPVVLIPNPFYQVYAVAALAAGAEPVFVPARAENGHLPDFAGLRRDVLDRTVAAYLCSPANPQGAVASADYLADLLALAEQHDFRVFADECYAEIYRDTPPPGILAVAAAQGADPERVLAFHSLSKRSNLPGLRSGFVAGGVASIRAVRQLRNYAGAPLPLPLQHAAARVWADEYHVIENRRLYNDKFALAADIFAGVQGYETPAGGFFLWLPVPEQIGTGEDAALKLWRETGVRVLPGGYLGRAVDGLNPADRYIRVALVTPLDDIARGLTALRDTIFR